MLTHWHRKRTKHDRLAADYRAGVLWAAILNSQGGVQIDPASTDPKAARRAVFPQEAFASLVEVLGEPPIEDGEGVKNTEALVGDLKRSWRAIDLRKRDDDG